MTLHLFGLFNLKSNQYILQMVIKGHLTIPTTSAFGQINKSLDILELRSSRFYTIKIIFQYQHLIQNLLMSLDQQTAIRRASIIRQGSIQYNFNIILEADKYHGLAEISFFIETMNFSQDLEVDFSGKTVEGLIINNIEVEGRRSKNFIFLPKSCLQKGKNKVSILYECEYDIDQSGFISFIDNGEQFVYTDFEPYFANRVFPCFDQPNLKARMRLTVVGPQTWRVVSHDDPITTGKFEATSFMKHIRQNSQFLERHLQAFSGKCRSNLQTRITYFPQTKLLPTYILCFAAGNYQQISSNNGTVPMSLYCPPSVLKNLERFSSFIFDITIKCMNFFEEKFNLKYPFTKYDQIFIKQCKFGAMENAGIVTFNQARCLPRQQATQYNYYYLGLIVAHELSHHWFGNYVTMVWWDDLWLNESFAEWISCYSIEKLKNDFDYKFQSSYLYFRDRKNWGYEQDERNSATHPIRGIVRNTFEAASIFDGITYAKGASTLKQLMYLVEQDNFLLALSNYFQRFQWGNATIDDLLEDLSKVFPSTDFSLNDWKRMWLEQSSLNIFQIDWDRVNKQITVNQSSFNRSNILRYHKIEIALFKADGSFDVLTKQLVNASLTTVLTYDLPSDYKAVLLNYNDETFAENIIDAVSLDFFMRNVDKIKDLFTRMMIWYNIQSMVNLSKVPLLDYVTLIQSKLFSEPSNFILEKVLKGARQYLNNFIDQNVGESLQSIMFRRIYQELQAVPDVQTERIQILQEQYIEFARSDTEITQLGKWLSGNDPNLKNRQMNFNQKWKVVRKIFTLPLSDTEKWDTFNKVKAQDQDAARVGEAETICKVLLANEAEFEAVYQELQSPDVSLAQKYTKIQGWKSPNHASWIISQYQDRYFTDLYRLCTTLGYDEFQFFYQNLGPIDSDLATQIQYYNIVISNFGLIGNLEEHRKNLRKIVDDLTLRMQNIAFNADIDTALTRQRAVVRYSYIDSGSIDYNYHITFVKDEQYYTGMAEITFTLNEVPLILPLECAYETLYTLNVNGVKMNPDTHGQFLYIPRENLVLGSNFISVHYRNKYNNDGLGCMSFIETISERSQYIYTKFEPYGAHRFIPCFDQPDLKAKAAFTVIVPEGWIVAGNEADSYSGAFSLANYEAKVTSKDKPLLQAYLKDKSGKFFVFPPTKVISTYLYCLVAGQYYELEATADQIYKDIPMSLFCIKSYSSALDDLGPFIFEMTTLSLQLYEQKFKVPYQFSKYDSVFCHEFKSGAMENPGIITFNDTYLYPEKVSLEKMIQFASTIVHENSHNWFGNFVTMKWWDDLWLNESFADFIAYYCLENIKNKVTTISKYDSGWKFFLVRGVVGYREDQITATTHAVRSPVQNTSIATTYFDRITYQKGSATLKQLMFLMGEQNFFNGVSDYFKDFGWKNGTIDDFLGKMQTYFDNAEFTLDDWKQSWLLTPSLNVVEVQWDPTDLTDQAVLQIKQNYYTPVYPELKYHKTRVAFFKEDATYDVVDVLLTPTGITALPYDGTKQYKAVLVNVDYWDYFKYTIDPESLLFFEANLDKIDNALTRTIIWHDINEQVRDSKYKIKNFVALFLKYIFTETDDKIFENEFSIIRDVINSYSPIDQRAALKTQIFEAAYNNLKNSPAKNDQANRVKLLKDQLTVFASTFDHIQLLEEWRVDNNPDLANFPITLTQAWEVVKLVYSVDDPSYTPQIKEQAYKDQYDKNPGIKGQLTLNTCNTIIADEAGLNDVYGSFKQMTLSLDAKLSFAEGWNNLRHLTLLRDSFKKRYFEDLPLLSRQLNSNHFESFYQNLKPIDDDLATTIAGYAGIKLEGSDMIGHMKVLTQIKYTYELRKGLYQYNA